MKNNKTETKKKHLKAFMLNLVYVCLDKCRTFEGGSCADVNKAILAQMRKWESADNCQSGGEKCLYLVCLLYTSPSPRD